MNYQRRSLGTGRSAYLESPVPIRSSLQDAIRPGTVASRIKSLQKLTSTSPPRSRPPPISISRGEDLRIGFGRRINNRFGKPALQNISPAEEPHNETACHSFLGLNTPRVNHEEHHIIAGQRTKYARSSGINGQTIADGTIARTQHDAVAPWGVLSRSRCTRSMGRHATDLESDIQPESKIFSRQARFGAESSTSCWEDETRYLDLYRRNVESRQPDTINSEISNTTSSTTRMQSVRDLFKDFGIERPAGLASREPSYDKPEAPMLMRRGTQCHICSSENLSVSIACSRCNHKLCLQCDASRENETWGTKEPDYRKGKPASKENRSTYRVVNETNLKPADSQKRAPLLSQDVPQPPSKLPIMQAVDFFASLKRSSQTLKRDEIFREGNSATPFRSGSQAPRCVKDSPFLIADLLSGKSSLLSRPNEWPAQADRLGYRNAQEHRLKELQKPPGATSASNGCKCSSPTCRATNHCHQPYRHAVSYIERKRPRHVQKDADKDYSAHASLVEEAVQSYPKSSRAKEYHTEDYSHREKPNARPTPISRLSAVNSQVSNEQETLEFVECHGYPRTGHSHLGSPVSSGIVGECQHCLHDCHCEACKSTHHNVRCCLHTDHQAVAHRHLTPQKGASLVSEKELSTCEVKSFEGPASSKSLTIVSPVSNRKAPAVTSISMKESFRHNQPSKRSAVDKMPSLSTVKRSSLLADRIAKPLTPPPWVTNPRKRSKAGITIAHRWQETRRDNVETLTSVKPPEDPQLSLKERATSPPPAPYPAGHLRSSNAALAALRCLNEPGMERQGSPRPPSQRSIIEKLARPASTRSPSKPQVSQPGSGRASRRLSALFQLRQQNSVGLLNQKLLEHQDELRRTQKDFDEKLKAVAKDAVDEFICGHERGETGRNIRPEEMERVERIRLGEPEGLQKAKAVRDVKLHGKDKAQSIKNSKGDNVKKKLWRIRLVDRVPSPACVNDESVRQHRLADDEVLSSKKSPVSLLEKGAEALPSDSQNHDCVWKSRLLELNGRELGIQGFTVLLHLERREDIIFKAVDWKGGELRREG
jgi:hypothetical protein